MGNLHPSIFRAYDIRGVVPEEITEDVAERVGRAMVIHTRATTVLVGRDMRTSSPALAEAVMRGVTAQGADVIDIGLCSTPMFNYAVASDAVVPRAARDHGTIAGIMVSASHNPAKYNGFKLDYGDALPVSAVTGMEEVKRLALAPFSPSHREGERGGVGSVTMANVLDSYLSHITSLLDPATLPPTRMVVCCGNGMGGLTMPRLAPKIPGDVIALHWELDGSFPNHEANPIKLENVRDLADAVRDAGAAVGFAYDGDADRLGVVDERGELVRGDLVAVLLAREVLRERPGSRILCDVRASRACAESVTESGGVSETTRVGHALIKKHLRETGAVFAGELSGHFYFDQFYGVECTELAMLMVLRLLARERRPLSEIVAPFVRYAYSGEVNFTVADPPEAIRELEARYASAARSISKLDGVQFDMGDWWFLVRPSNTVPLVRLIVETPTQRATDARVEEIAAVIRG
ncbi:phosphomannomutase/phosphoglucomutase [Candidatus Uhrbacteria bacterium]|nr:phosphomannomutase/phosphoglucomutase [Candidatus Uhrbacteria bacterium]